MPSSNGSRLSAEVENHEAEVEAKEAYEYWGFLFKKDKTGTERFKGLLRGLKDVMNEKYEPTDNPDLTPNQLAHFYRELNGNYDQLFLGTPSDSIAFIYKSLGCLHSLQPLPHSTAFTDPTVPALKTEGWIMWQTIQVLLAPDEHSHFLIEAVHKWDVKDPETGETMPKLLPRRCFPAEPDKHMVAWYEGVSGRLRKEAEEEEKRRDIEAQEAETRRINDRPPHPDTDEEGSVDSKAPALAYFRNPLYRHVDGRPSIIRRLSKRPGISPKPTMIDKGKGAASSVGHVIKNIGSPHLWEGKTASRSRERERPHREHRRRSMPENRFQEEQPLKSPAEPEEKQSPHHHRRHKSGQPEFVEHGVPVWDPENAEHVASPNSRPPRNEDRLDPTLRHSRSHEPTPSQKEDPDYFHGYYDENPEPQGTPPANNNNMGGGFAPSQSPLFASHVAKQPQPPPPPPPLPRSDLPPPRNDFPPPDRRPPSARLPRDRPYASPDPTQRFRDRERDDRDDPRRYSSHDRERRSRYDSPSSMPPRERSPPPRERSPPRHRGSRRRGRSGEYDRRDEYVDRSPPWRERSRGHRASGSEVSGPEDRERDDGRRKQTRFTGVDGRRYPPYEERR